jgi:hypothetical protein
MVKYEVYINNTLGGYGFANNWTLNIKKGDVFKSFYLGQDVKFLNRVLGINADYIKNVLNISGGIDFEKHNKKITYLVINLLSNNEERGTRKPTLKVIDSILKAESWAFAGD